MARPRPPVGQASRHARQVPQWLSRFGASYSISALLTQRRQKEPASLRAIQQQRVLADPAQAGQLGELALQQRRRVDHAADGCLGSQPAVKRGERLKPLVDAVVVVQAPGVARDPPPALPRPATVLRCGNSWPASAGCGRCPGHAGGARRPPPARSDSASARRTPAANHCRKRSKPGGVTAGQAPTSSNPSRWASSFKAVVSSAGGHRTALCLCHPNRTSKKGANCWLVQQCEGRFPGENTAGQASSGTHAGPR